MDPTPDQVRALAVEAEILRRRCDMYEAALLKIAAGVDRPAHVAESALRQEDQPT